MDKPYMEPRNRLHKSKSGVNIKDAEELQQQCEREKTPFFFKQIGGWNKKKRSGC